jgi:hypothetical protein
VVRLDDPARVARLAALHGDDGAVNVLDDQPLGLVGRDFEPVHHVGLLGADRVDHAVDVDRGAAHDGDRGRSEGERGLIRIGLGIVDRRARDVRPHDPVVAVGPQCGVVGAHDFTLTVHIRLAVHAPHVAQFDALGDHLGQLRDLLIERLDPLGVGLRFGLLLRLDRSLLLVELRGQLAVRLLLRLGQLHFQVVLFTHGQVPPRLLECFFVLRDHDAPAPSAAKSTSTRSAIHSDRGSVQVNWRCLRSSTVAVGTRCDAAMKPPTDPPRTIASRLIVPPAARAGARSRCASE